MSARARRLWAVAAIGLLLVVGAIARERLALSLGPEALREAVRGLGLWGPLAVVLLVGFRHVLFFPSQLVLLAAGVGFGFAKGTLYGTLGLALSGTLAFSLARLLGADVAQRYVPARIFRAVSGGGGALVVAVGTGHPVGLMTPLHVGAGLSAMPLRLFAPALLLGALCRAALYCYLGSSVLERGLLDSWPALLLLCLLLLPFAHRATRTRMLRLLFGEAEPKPNPNAKADQSAR